MTVEISNIDDLQAMRDDLNEDYVLVNDIDASDTTSWNNGAGFDPVGGWDPSWDTSIAFEGTLDGNNHTINDLYIDTTDNFAGLFGVLNGTVKDVTFESANVSGGDRVGIAVGLTLGDVLNVTTKGKVGEAGGNYVGGIAGQITGIVEDSSAKVTVTAADRAGGITGWNHFDGTINRSGADGTVTSETSTNDCAGGIAAVNSGLIENSYSLADVTDGDYVGGAVGWHGDGTVATSYAAGKVSTGQTATGGLIGDRGGASVSNSYWDAEATGQSSSAGGTGLTTSEMTGEAVEANMDFDFEETWLTQSDDYPIHRGGPERKTAVSASVTTLQFIPGKEENTSRGGHPLDSALMQIFPEDGRWGVWGVPIEATVDPVFDSWMGGDMIDELSGTLVEAREKKFDKYIDDTGPGEEFSEYRFENGVRVSFEANDGSIDKDTIKIKFSEAGPTGDDPLISRGDRVSSNTVLHDHPINGIPWEDWYDQENVRPSRREPRHYEYYTDFEFQGTEGVRVVTFWGGWAGFMGDIAHRAGADPSGFLGEIWDWGFVEQTLLYLVMRSAPEKVHFFLEAITTVPRTWTFLDFIVLADGRRYARVWDASQYPSLYTYVDGVLKAREDMPYETKQIWNETMFAFYARAMAGATPYGNLLKYYEMSLASETLSLELERTINELIDRLDLGWLASDLMPQFPRETLGFDGDASDPDTEPLDNPDEPFPLFEGTFFPLASKLPPE